MKKILIYLMLIFVFTACSTEPEESCGDPVIRIIELIENEPDTWSVIYVYNKKNKLGQLKHTPSGVVVTQISTKKYYMDSWSTAKFVTWKITKPHTITLSSEESDEIEKVFVKWYNKVKEEKNNNAKCDVLKLLK